MITHRKMVAAYAVAFLYELENLLRKRAGYMISAAYLLLVAAVCMSQSFRESYFSWAMQVPISLVALVLPAVMMLLITVSLSSVFSSEAERASAEIPACCLMGSQGRNTAKLLAGIAFSIIMGAALLAATVGITSITGHLNLIAEVAGIDYYGMTYWELNPVWTVGEHLLLSVISQAIGATALAVISLFISKHSKTPATAMAVTVAILLAEFFFRHFGPFPLVLTEINVWGLFEGFMLLDMDLLHGAPVENLAMISGIWMVICGALSFAVIRQKYS